MTAPRLRLLRIVAIAAVVAVSCSGSDEPGDAPTNTTSPAPATTPPPQATTEAPPAPPAPTTAAPTTQAPAPTTPAPTTTATPAATTASPPATEPPPEGTIITIGDLFFRPSTITVTAGETVVWQHDGSFPHTTTAGTPGDRTGEWHSGTMSGGDTFSVTFDSAGTFQYFCTIHPNDMQATITVTDG
jgi:plastocyanin